MRLAIIVVTLALAFPAVATAKEVTRVDVCGADGCGRISDHGSLEAFMEGDDQPATVPFGPQRSYTLRVRMRAEEGEAVHGWTTHWIPKANVLAYQDEHGQFAFTDVPAKLRHAHGIRCDGGCEPCTPSSQRAPRRGQIVLNRAETSPQSSCPWSARDDCRRRHSDCQRWRQLPCCPGRQANGQGLCLRCQRFTN